MVACATHRIQARARLLRPTARLKLMLPAILAHGGASDFQLSASMKSGIEIHTRRRTCSVSNSGTFGSDDKDLLGKGVWRMRLTNAGLCFDLAIPLPRIAKYASLMISSIAKTDSIALYARAYEPAIQPEELLHSIRLARPPPNHHLKY